MLVTWHTLDTYKETYKGRLLVQFYFQIPNHEIAIYILTYIFHYVNYYNEIDIRQ